MQPGIDENLLNDILESEWGRATFVDFQKKGLCGEIKSSGRRCTNKIIERFELDPDLITNKVSVGACGVHVSDVKARVKLFSEKRWRKDEIQWQVQEAERILPILESLGLHFEMDYRQFYVKFTNIGHLIAKMIELGVITEEEIEQKFLEEKERQKEGEAGSA